MRVAKIFLGVLLFTALFFIYSIISSGCAQIGAPTGGPKDTIPPVLVGAIPSMRAVNFNANKIVFTFDEYIDIQDVSTNVLVSPYPKKQPTITNKLKTLTVKLKDTLRPNTTYSIDFGNAIKDINEGNVLKHFIYVFSTGSKIDSMQVRGKVTLAETGKTDSTLFVMLYKDLDDTAVQKNKPDYVARVDNKGKFTFINLPPGDFNIFAIENDVGSKTYTSKSQLFAFADSVVHVSDTTSPVDVDLYAYQQEKEEKKKNTTTNGGNSSTAKKKEPKEKRLRFNTSFSGKSQDLLSDLTLTFTDPLKNFDSTKIFLTDTNFNQTKGTIITIDTTRKIVSVKTAWAEDADYRLIIDKDAVSDSTDLTLRKTDTLSFTTKSASDYGTILIRVLNFDKSKHPVLQFVQADKIVKSVPLKTAEWSDDLFPPGDYDLRILFDANDNGIWDPGNYLKKIQPERVISFDKKLTIKADWDNEREIEL
jgi:hypothetical protein